jgi:FAS-associated factor 2
MANGILCLQSGGLWSFVSSLLGFPPRRAGLVRDPQGDVRAFAADFESNFGPSHPPFYLGSYLQVLEEAKKELKFLLVYLHAEEHQDTQRFCATTLTHPRVVDYVSQNMLFWGCSVSRPEGCRVSEALRECTYPFLAVIVLRQNRMVVVGRQEGYIDPTDLIDWLEKVVREDCQLLKFTSMYRVMDPD